MVVSLDLMITKIVLNGMSDDKETQRVYGIINDIVQGVISKLNNE